MENDNNEYNQNYNSEDSKSDAGTLESVDNAILTDYNSGADHTKEVKDGKDGNEGKDAISFLESSMDRSNIEQEALDSVDSNRQYSLVNTRALLKEATTYELEYFEKRALVIFNQEKIDGQDTRHGTEKDVDSLTRTFENIGFEVTTHTDLTKDALFDELKKFSERDFTDYGCVVVAILTHGEIGRLGAKDQLYKEVDVINYFKDYSKLTLVTKPKIFIIQACRYPIEGSGQESEEIRKADAKDLEPYYILPLESDLLILHSTYPGHPSFRNTKSGSWFIQALCKKIDTLSLTQDLESIVTEVKRDVAIEKELGEYYGSTLIMIYKQMPVMTSTLIRKLYLKKFDETYVDKLRRRSESKHEVLAEASSSSMKPLLDQFEPCSCVLEHFTYMRNCLRFFVAENPNDEIAKGFLDVANTYDDSVGFDKLKDAMCKDISEYLMDKAQDSQFYKYLHFVPVERKTTT